MNTNNFFETLFVPVKVSERLPEKDRFYTVIVWYGRVPVMQEAVFKNGRFYSKDDDLPYEITSTLEWLESLTNRYVFTKEELDELIRTAIIQGYPDGEESTGLDKKVETVLKSLQWE